MTDTETTTFTDISSIHRNDQRRSANEEIINVTALTANHYRSLRSAGMPKVHAAQLAANMQAVLMHERAVREGLR